MMNRRFGLWLGVFFLAASILLALAAFGQSNSFQPFQPFGSNYIARTSSGGVSLPQSGNIVFQWDTFDGEATPQVGSITYTRTGTIAVPTSQYGWTKYTANQVPFAKRHEGTEDFQGVYFSGAITNYLTYSEDFTNAAWTAVGGGSATGNTADGPFGTTGDADTISGSSAGDGLEQASSRAAASEKFVFSVWLKATTGNPIVTITVQDGGSEGGFMDCELTQNWVRYEVPHVFSAAASGNVKVQILVGNTSTVRAIGAQLEDFSSGSTGTRIRYSSANFYVPTTSAAASAGNTSALIPNSIATTMQSTGSFAAWVLTDVDMLDAYQNAPYLFSLGAEEFALFLDVNTGPALWLNSGARARPALFNQQSHTTPVHYWTHYAATWDTASDVYKVYMNGVEVGTTLSATTDWSAGAADIHLGGYDPLLEYLGADAVMSQIVFWDTALSASEVASAYAVKSGSAQRSEPGTGLIFSVDLGSSPIPTVGDKHYYYAQRGTANWHYHDSTTSSAPATRTTFPIQYPLNGYNRGGYTTSGTTENLVLQSEDFSTTWTKINGAEIVSTNIVTAPDGNTTADIIVGTAAGHGVEQTVAVASASAEYVFSVYARASDNSSRTAVIRIEDTGDTEGSEVTINLTTSWERYWVYHNFSSGTGNTDVQIIVGDTTGYGVYFWGAQLEKTNNAPYLLQSAPSQYIPTTTALVKTFTSTLIYRGRDSLNLQRGTLIAWAFSDVENPTDYVTSAMGPTILGAPGQNINFYLHMLRNTIDLEYAGINGTSAATFSNTRRQWTHYAWAWDNTGTNAQLYIWVDGVLVYSKTDTPSTYILSGPRKFIVGHDFTGTGLDNWQGGIAELDIYGEAKDTAFVLADFNATKSGYGR